MKNLFVSLSHTAAFLFQLSSARQALPKVDLGYEIHQALSYNETGQLYQFTNIRYAQPPLGDLRFAAPVAPTGRNPVVQTGNVSYICPQAGPAWGVISNSFQSAYISNDLSRFNYTHLAEMAPEILPTLISELNYGTAVSEDCLFLDVTVPKQVFNRSSRKRAPVVVWIYGGAYTLGSKGVNAAGLIKASQFNNASGVIHVAMNYRLGAFGWLAGPTLQGMGGVSNAGLYDQRLALEWVQKYIHLFGGDPNQVTVMGESAGGGSIMHQITAYGGNKPSPFQRAIIQSPGLTPTVSQFKQENKTQTFLSLLNVSTIEEARQLSSDDLINANSWQVGNASYSDYVWGPVVDGLFVPALPGILLLNGGFSHNVSVMVGHNKNESPSFTPPWANNTAAIRALFPGTDLSVIDYIVNELYPANFSDPAISARYNSGINRTIAMVNEEIFTCNTNYLARAFENETYNYEFQVAPALHGQDVSYTYWNGEATDHSTGVSHMVAPIAKLMQAYITNFIATGNPNGPGLPIFPKQGHNATMLGISGNSANVKVQPDDTANMRCVWWQKALWL
ncbi:Secreted lipase [Penicillium chrysogenum]|uniref:Carboxylic ester hydrolase n=1 Tax=Penicillium chrysogenum TaxID=5076 RepID=A0A162CPU4_PENCH|nr:Secreted lipase [Penicillium chrysogenum]